MGPLALQQASGVRRAGLTITGAAQVRHLCYLEKGARHPAGDPALKFEGSQYSNGMQTPVICSSTCVEAVSSAPQSDSAEPPSRSSRLAGARLQRRSTLSGAAAR